MIQEINILGDDSIGLCEKKIHTKMCLTEWLLRQSSLNVQALGVAKKKETAYCYFKLIFNVMFKRQASYSSE